MALSLHVTAVILRKDNHGELIEKLHVEKGIYLIQFYDKSPYIHRKLQKGKVTTQKLYKKLLLHSDCGPA